MDFSHLQEIYPANTNVGYCYKNRNRCFKKCFEKQPLKQLKHEATGEFIGNRIVNKTVKQKPVPNKKSMLKKQLFYQRKDKKF